MTHSERFVIMKKMTDGAKRVSRQNEESKPSVLFTDTFARSIIRTVCVDKCLDGKIIGEYC